jgi:Asp-tRNA(Asn)/Glu-tRNA(Gln) amidotransferase B subunit
MNKMAIALLPVMGLSMFVAPSAFAADAHPNPEKVAQRQTNLFTREANLLGLTVDEVKSAWAEGKNLIELAKEHGISKEDLIAKMKALAAEKADAHLQILVEQGVITQAQADEREKFVDARIENHKGFHPLRRFFHGRK